jgi:iron(III) transport system permease protein
MLSGAVVIASLAIPLGMLMSWSIRALSDPATFQAVWQTGSQNFSNYILNSVWTALLAAGAAVILSLPVAILAVRHAGRLSQALSRFSQVGYAVPGVVTALSVVLLVNRLVPVLYATPLVIVLAYVLRYMPQAVRAAESALKQLSPSFEEASRISGKKPLFTFVRVTLPLILPGLLAGGALVFMSAIKELPATLLLRPAGFDTLAVRVWIWANDGFFLQAAPAALSLVLISILPLSLLLRKEQSSK